MTRAIELAATSTVRLWIRDGRVRRIREAAGLSQSEMAELAGTSAQSVSRWEQGQRLPRSAQAIRYHRALVSLLEITAAAVADEVVSA